VLGQSRDAQDGTVRTRRRHARRRRTRRRRTHRIRWTQVNGETGRHRYHSPIQRYTRRCDAWYNPHRKRVVCGVRVYSPRAHAGGDCILYVCLGQTQTDPNRPKSAM